MAEKNRFCCFFCWGKDGEMRTEELCSEKSWLGRNSHNSPSYHPNFMGSINHHNHQPFGGVRFVMTGPSHRPNPPRRSKAPRSAAWESDFGASRRRSYRGILMVMNPRFSRLKTSRNKWMIKYDTFSRDIMGICHHG